MINIAVLLTCHNRSKLTFKCIKTIIKAYENYGIDQLHIHYYLTDDLCTDDTLLLVRGILGNDEITIIKADGNAFWAGGMRLAWSEALKGFYDYYLLVNDDVEVWDNLFFELFGAEEFAVKKYGIKGIYSGNTSETNDKNKITFGGKVRKGIFVSRYKRLYPNGIPQHSDIVNANILMVSNVVVNKIGIFPDCYVHGCADNDYGLRANKAGFPVLITAGFCGTCNADNYVVSDELFRLKGMSFRERYKYLHFPVHSIRDLLCFSLRWRKTFVPIIIIRQVMFLLCPGILYYIYLKK